MIIIPADSGYCDNNMLEKDWHCRLCGMPALLGDLAGVTQARKRQSCSRICFHK